MGNAFFTFFKYRPKRSKKFFLRNYIRLYKKIAFGLDFRPQEVPELENIGAGGSSREAIRNGRLWIF